MTRGVVKFFKAEKGWGAISSEDLPPGQDVFVHFAHIEATGYRELRRIGGQVIAVADGTPDTPLTPKQQR